MSESGGSSADPLGTETFEQSDEALAEGTRLDPDYIEKIEDDPSLDPREQVDELELAEVGAVLDDPEDIASLAGGMDDPDGIDPSARIRRDSDGDGWDLDAPVTPGS